MNIIAKKKDRAYNENGEEIDTGFSILFCQETLSSKLKLTKEKGKINAEKKRYSRPAAFYRMDDIRGCPFWKLVFFRSSQLRTVHVMLV